MLLSAVLAIAACSTTSAPSVRSDADPQLVAGRQLYINQCAACHGQSGQGGRGPKFSGGSLLESYPDLAANLEQVANGQDKMPAFSGRLTPDEILSVVRYTREVLAAE